MPAWLVGVLIGVFIFAIVLLNLRKPGWLPDGRGMLVHALIIPVSVSVLLIVAFTLIIWGVQTDPRETMDFAGTEVSVEALRTASTLLGVGIVTGVVAGTIISLVERWQDFER